MKKYIAIVAYKNKPGFKHYELDADNIHQAMDQAENLKNKRVYTIWIAKKSGKTENVDGVNVTSYTEILSNSEKKWCAIDDDAETWTCNEALNKVWFSLVCL